MMRTFLLARLLVMMVCGAMLWPAAISDASAQGTVRISLSAENDRVTVNGTVKVSIRTEQAAGLNGLQFTLNYNPSLVELLESKAELDRRITENGITLFPISDKLFDKEAGAITYAVQTNEETESFEIAELTFKGLRQGEAEVRLSAVKAVDSHLFELAAGGEQSLLLTVQGPNSPNPSPGGAGEAEAGDRHRISENDLKTGSSDGRITLNIPSGTKEVVLTAGAASQVKNQPLLLHFNGLSMAMEPELLQQFIDLANKDQGWEQAEIRIGVNAVTEEESEHYIESGSSDSLRLWLAGGIYQLELSIVTKDGQVIKADRFVKPLRLSMPYDEGTNDDLLGIYTYYPETREWEYASSAIDRVNGLVHADVYHFSPYAVLEYRKSFLDVSADHWAYDGITVLSAKQIVEGVTATQFAPQKQTTRAEFAALLARVLDLKADKNVSFDDVKSSDWYADAVAAAFEAGIIKGKSEKQFKPKDAITREEMAELLVRAFEYETKTSLDRQAKSVFKDSNEISSWASSGVHAAVNIQLMKGIGDARFAPLAFTTRAQTAQALYNFLGLLATGVAQASRI